MKGASNPGTPDIACGAAQHHSFVGEHGPEAGDNRKGGQEQAREQELSFTFAAVAMRATGMPSPVVAT
jgi:hypothetical protein